MMAAVSSMDNMYGGLAVIDSAWGPMHARAKRIAYWLRRCSGASSATNHKAAFKPAELLRMCSYTWAANAKIGYAKKDQLLHSDGESMLCQFL